MLLYVFVSATPHRPHHVRRSHDLPCTVRVMHDTRPFRSSITLLMPADTCLFAMGHIIFTIFCCCFVTCVTKKVAMMHVKTKMSDVSYFSFTAVIVIGMNDAMC